MWTVHSSCAPQKAHPKSEDCLQVLLWVQSRRPGQELVPSYKLQCLQHTITAVASWKEEENAIWYSDGLARTS